jgi:hypothetical protein
MLTTLLHLHRKCTYDGAIYYASDSTVAGAQGCVGSRMSVNIKISISPCGQVPSLGRLDSERGNSIITNAEISKRASCAVPVRCSLDSAADASLEET